MAAHSERGPPARRSRARWPTLAVGNGRNLRTPLKRRRRDDAAGRRLPDSVVIAVRPWKETRAAIHRDSIAATWRSRRQPPPFGTPVDGHYPKPRIAEILLPVKRWRARRYAAAARRNAGTGSGALARLSSGCDVRAGDVFAGEVILRRDARLPRRYRKYKCGGARGLWIGVNGSGASGRAGLLRHVPARQSGRFPMPAMGAEMERLRRTGIVDAWGCQADSAKRPVTPGLGGKPVFP
jgi:hypothetical protein